MLQDYNVKPGDCVSSIAFEHGFFWKTLWDDPANSELKRRRKTPFQLLPGDCLTIPELREKQESGACEKRHRFRLKGVPAMVRIKILEMPTANPPPDDSAQPSDDEGTEGAEVLSEEEVEEFQEPQPARNKPYHVVIDGARGPNGQTDDEGMIELMLPPNAQEAELTLEPATPRERLLRVQLGYLDPLDVPSGQAHRLVNLGFGTDASGEDADALGQALAEFQTSQGLEPTGRADSATLDKLKEVHGG